jgi:hypothetical protein
METEKMNRLELMQKIILATTCLIQRSGTVEGISGLAGHIKEVKANRRLPHFRPRKPWHTAVAIRDRCLVG